MRGWRTDAASSGAGERSCGWCEAPFGPGERRTKKYCGRKCRQSGFRLRRRSQLSATPAAAPGLTFAYADPPYPGTAKKYYGAEADYAGEVDHAALIASLTAADYAGWALSTSSKALRDILPLCPPCAWLFDLMGMVPGDHLVDLYPGSGIVGRAWAELSSRTSTTPDEPKRCRPTVAWAGRRYVIPGATL
ncbi:MAG: hypothetical protein ACREX8_05855 [Gammaproteobacteria bacterium]